MFSFSIARRMPLLAFGVLFIIASVLTVQHIPGNLTSDVTGTCGNSRLDKGEDCEKGIATFANPCSGSEQCDVGTCLCPSRKYASVSSSTCIGEGKQGSFLEGGNPGKCCDGLKPVKHVKPEPSSNQCIGANDGSFFCAPCGNGSCDERDGENSCSCPQDCKKAFQASACGNGVCEKGEELPCPPCLPGSTTCTCSGCARDCDNDSFRHALWQCYNGDKSEGGDSTSCKDRKTWESYANDSCKGKCNADSTKCGVNSFGVSEPCGSSFPSSASSCIGEGKYGSPTSGDLSTLCCAGLSPMKNAKPAGDGQCVATNDMGFTCAPCGNGVCDERDRENSCNCPGDCGTQNRKCAVEGQKVYGNSQFGPTLCCSKNAGVKPSARAVDSGQCIAPTDGSLGTCIENWWRTCGDGTCGKGEDRCNCPKDCGKAACGNGTLEAGEECEKGVSCPIPSCAQGAVCPGYICNSSTCRCEREQVPSSATFTSTSPIPCPAPYCDGAIFSGEKDGNGCPRYSCPTASSSFGGFSACPVPTCLNASPTGAFDANGCPVFTCLATASSSVTSVVVACPAPQCSTPSFTGVKDGNGCPVYSCTSSSPVPVSASGSVPPIVGGDRDAYGCIPSAGYSWCASKQKCLRPWEEECPSAFAVSSPAAGFEDVVLLPAASNPFSDTDLSTLVGESAADLYHRGVIGGYADGTFKGSRTVNRAEAAKFLLLAKYGTVPELAGTAQFPDVLPNQWFTQFVLVAAEKGIISGYPDGTFRPANTVNTAEFLKMLTLTFDLPQNLPFTYTDVPAGSWFAPYAGVAEFYQLFPSRTTQLFPDRELTRGDVVIAVNKCIDL